MYKIEYLINSIIKEFNWYISKNSKYYIGNLNYIISKTIDNIYIIIPIYKKLIYNNGIRNNIYTKYIYSKWHNNYIIIHNTTNDNILKNMLNIVNTKNNSNNNNNNNNSNNNNIKVNLYSYYTKDYIYLSYIYWFIYYYIGINSIYKSIILDINIIYNPIFKIDIFTKYIHNNHNNYSINYLYKKIEGVFNSLIDITNKPIVYSSYYLEHKGRWNSTVNTTYSTNYKKIGKICNSIDNNINTYKIIGVNEYGISSMNIKLYYYNSTIFNKEYIF